MSNTREPFDFRRLGIFLALAALCWMCAVGAEMVPQSSTGVVLIVRTAIALLGLTILGLGSERLLTDQFGGNGSLHLRPSLQSVLGISVGVVGGIIFVTLVAGIFWLAARFHFESGSLSLKEGLLEARRFLLSNAGEELIFRGYLLIVLARRFGLHVALLFVGILFGLFHLPGLTGITALKMFLSTAACSYLFAAAFLWTGTIWAAVGLHFSANVMLHTVTGLSGGRAALKPVFQVTPPGGVDFGFWILLTVALLLALPFVWCSSARQ